MVRKDTRKPDELMRIIFVGIHNKPSMAPLDSRTNSGRKVDGASAQIKAVWPGVEVVKSNYFDRDDLPVAYDCYSKYNFKQWADRVNFDQLHDIAIPLGAIVHNEFVRGAPKGFLFKQVPHPSFCPLNEFLEAVMKALKQQMANGKI